ncbi:MAG: ribonuclease P protein component [Candidatus Nomurabacteria bacterium]|jgi:ribonuclease P protein component|nr:ribonuclease P protein component [Candidatus Nomurabacteria bacterium]
MISQKHRFHGHASLKYVFANGHGVRSRFFTIKYVENLNRHNSRASVVVSKKVYKSAVKRNRIRRRVYEIIRPFLKKNSPALDFVVSVYSPEALTASHDELTIQLLPMFEQIGLK